MENNQLSITYYGHSCFKVEYDGESILFDPYDNDSVPNLTLPEGIIVNLVLCSHQHQDHNATHLVTATHGLKNMHIDSFEVPHDDANGKLRGMCEVNIVSCGPIRIAHLGDIGCSLTTSQIEQLKGIDVLMIPVGGYFTIDARQAKTIIEEVQAKCTILMHYYNNGIGYDVIASLDEVKQVIPSVIGINESVLSFDINQAPYGIFTLVPLQK